MKNFIKHNWYIFLLYIITLALIAPILLHYDKVQIHKLINAHVGNVFFDNFFKYITDFGDGIFAIILILIIGYYNVKNAAYILSSYVLASLFTTVLKRIFYPHIFRPDFTFKYFVGEKLNLVDGVNMLSSNSFPSGHATSAFAVFIALLFICKSHSLKLLIFITAILTSFSRTYISQHWLIDIYVGSVIGFVAAIVLYVVFYRQSKFTGLDVSFKQLIKKNKRV